MADTKITDLTAKTAPAGTEEVPLNDTGTDKKMTLTNLMKTPMTWTGDVTISSTQVTAIGAGKVLSSMLAAAVNVIGKQDQWVPAVADWITTTSGATAVAKAEMATNLNNYQAISFVNGATNRAEFTWVPPRNWDFGTIKITFYYYCTNASGNSVTWRASGVAIADAGALDVAQGTQQTVAKANGGANILNISAQTPAITIAGTPASTKMVQIRLERQTGDTLAFPALLLGVVIEYSITQATAA